MLPNDIDTNAASGVCEGDIEGMSGDGFDYLFAMHTLEESHLFFLSRSLAVSAGLIRLFFGNVQRPETE
jgi:hypothetical protein